MDQSTCGAIKEIKIAKKENKVLGIIFSSVNPSLNFNKKIEIISSLPNSIFEISFVIIILFMIKFIVDLGAQMHFQLYHYMLLHL